MPEVMMQFVDLEKTELKATRSIVQNFLEWD